ncbi:unnamed protein product [Pleuronectes platessa]|uniref:Uncharacterized protein n=1 Tax=Pleuronectes platessa TaxID=8262 RepID=A0A9N7VNZ8_PLEPL|nr:unnamed protein product [Pleuronectes platessa]
MIIHHPSLFQLPQTAASCLLLLTIGELHFERKALRSAPQSHTVSIASSSLCVPGDVAEHHQCIWTALLLLCLSTQCLQTQTYTSSTEIPQPNGDPNRQPSCCGATDVAPQQEG